MTIDRQTRWYACVCEHNAIAISDESDSSHVIFQVWEPRGGGLTWRGRVKAAWRVLRGLGAHEETILEHETARAMAEHILSVLERKSA